ncbi:unnamed protein product, partial [marine sediment metagenome]
HIKIDVDIWHLDDTEINTAIQKSGGIILTDDYVPVENLLAPVVLDSAIDLLTEKYLEKAKKLRKEGKWDKSISIYKYIISIDPILSPNMYNEIAKIKVQQGKLIEATEAFHKAIEYNEQAEFKTSVAGIHLNLGLLLKELGQPEEAREQFRKAIEGFRKELTKNPNSLKSIISLGITLVEVRELSEAIKYLQQAVNMDPFGVQNHLMLAQTFVIQERYDEAIKQLRSSIAFMLENGQNNDATQLQSFLDSIESEESIK